jgi:hypothetical protein
MKYNIVYHLESGESYSTSLDCFNSDSSFFDKVLFALESHFYPRYEDFRSDQFRFLTNGVDIDRGKTIEEMYYNGITVNLTVIVTPPIEFPDFPEYTIFRQNEQDWLGRDDFSSTLYWIRLTEIAKSKILFLYFVSKKDGELTRSITQLEHEFKLSDFTYEKEIPMRYVHIMDSMK